MNDQDEKETAEVAHQRQQQVSYGAKPPPGMEWQVGKTVREIRAISEESEATGKSLAEVAAGEDWKKRLPPSKT